SRPDTFYKQIADCLKIHYTAFSKVVSKRGKRKERGERGEGYFPHCLLYFASYKNSKNLGSIPLFL
ncbi:MAG: hypothetical protein AAB257_07395, partial [Nitrospinota bacterium]